MEAVQLGAAVDGDDVALLEDVLGGDAVHHLVVDGGAEGAREAVVALEAGRGALLADVGLGDLVELQEAHAGPGGAGGQTQGVGGDAAGLAHLVDFLAALVADLFADQDDASLGLQSNG